jgi:tetratricopeptide (TPR) repeat protein
VGGSGEDSPKERRIDSISSGDTIRDGTVPAALLGDRYEVLGELGRGAFGQVYRARDRVADTIVAVKVLTKGPSGSRDAVARFRRELQAARKVTHPGVVRIHDLVDLGDRLALSMELVEGATLEARLKRGPTPTAGELVELASDLARALAAAHRSGVVHRDLKPANIILRATNGRAVITDFGVSRLAGAVDAPVTDQAISDDLTRSGELIGTPRYMSPEQLRGGEIGPTADIYALGVVLYEAATGAIPHGGRSLVDLLRARTESSPPPLGTRRSDLPPALCQLVDRCLAPDPAQRPRDGDEVKAALTSLAGAGDFTAKTRRSRRPRWPWAATALLLVAAGAAVYRYETTLPSHDRAVWFEVIGRGDRADDWLAPAIRNMARHRLGDRDWRVRPVSSAEEANVTVRLEYARTDDGLELSVSTGRRGGRLALLDRVRSKSVSEALDRALPLVVDRVCAGQSPRPADANERSLMQRMGTSSVEAFRTYQATDNEAFGAILVDVDTIVAGYRRASDLDPEWLHPRIAIADSYGFGSDRWRHELEGTRAVAARVKHDPLGHHMIDAMTAMIEGRTVDAGQILDGDFEKNPDDILLGWLLARRVLHVSGRTQEAAAIYQKLFSMRPELQFGANLGDELRRSGRRADVPAVVDGWLKLEPASEQAYATKVAIDLETNHAADGVKHAREMVFLFGDAPNRLATLCSALISAEELRPASEIADQMLRGAAPQRARAWTSLGTIATLQGRFGQALSDFQSAVTEGGAYTTQASVRAALESRRWLAKVVGSKETDRFFRDISAYYRATSNPWMAATVELQRSLNADPGHCPDVEAIVAGLPDTPARQVVRLQMLRSAALAGCGSCRDVISNGMSVDEQSQESLFEFGVCAAQEGQLELARDVFDRTARPLTPAADIGSAESPAHAVLSRYHLARVLERLGRPGDARQEFQRFLDQWGHADRPLAEVDAARAALARLR